MGQRQIEIFQETIQEQLLGPGSDIYSDDSTFEIISDYPLKRYYTGIVFPERSLCSQGEADTESFDSDSDDAEYPDSENINEISDSAEGLKDTQKDSKEEITLSNHFFPSNMGISFCIDESVDSIQANFSFAVYSQPKQTEVSIKITRTIYQTLIHDKYDFPFKDIINYVEIDEHYGLLSLKRELKGRKKGRTEDYASFDGWIKNVDPDFKETIWPAHNEFNKLITRTWQRTPVEITRAITLSHNIDTPKALPDFKSAGYTLKMYEVRDRKYVKIQLVNLFPAILSDQFSSTKELLNESCFFQAKISINTDKLRSYKPFDATKFYTDKEYQKLEFLYKDMEHFSIGHNCATEWFPLLKPTKVETTFVPIYDLKATKTDVSGLKNIPLYDLSIWGNTQDEVIRQLGDFVNEYKDWIYSQKQKQDAQSDIGTQIINQLDVILDRLNESVGLLSSNDKLFKAFQYANTAMLLQFSLDGDFYQNMQDIDFKESEQPNFSNEQKKASYRPFQLAFLLISLESVINPKSEYRVDNVDLIWFPTGGGKTEAYLSVAALTIVWRRMSSSDYSGVSVIMRYTLRLLTAQQFERASKLITVLEFLRQQFIEDLKSETISIGLWIGGSSTPNNLEDALDVVKNIDKRGESANQFQLDKCSWCGSKLIQESNPGVYTHAFHVRGKKRDLKIKCLNKDCFFHNKKGLPIQVVDEVLYNIPPSLLFATVDKFAMLSWIEEGHNFFNSLNKKGTLPPDLIIQDELHLLTGPLGSIVALFESIIEDLCTKDGIGPKIIASTATTRNTEEQVKQLYGNRSVNIFPPPGLSHEDSFFAKQSKYSNRRYLGFMPTGKTGVDSQIHLLTTLFIARLKIFIEDSDEVNPYWTLVSYYNSLKDVGRMSNKVGDELQALVKQSQKRLKLSEYGFNHYGLKSRSKELTSRVDSAKIKQTLDQLEQDFELEKSDKGNNYVNNDIVDFILATNMLSVGIDIDRLNVMQINGVPRNTAEYIQASSRVGRKDKGLVVTLFDSNRARDKSYFENFLSFHQSLYKQIEPLSITPFTENTIDKMISSLLVAYVRHKQGFNKNKDIKHFTTESIEGLKILLKKRFPDNSNIEFCSRKIDELATDWDDKIKQDNPYDKYKGKEGALLSKPDQSVSADDSKWIVMQSMRDIDSSSFIQIQHPFIGATDE
jgi:hypothetical protein